MAAGTALVTGGRGFVGAWLARALLDEGLRVASLDAPSSGRPSTPALLGIEGEIEEVNCDLRYAEGVAEALAGVGAEVVFHLAARTIVGDAARAPAEALDTNVRGTWTVLEACREAGVGRVVVASSDKAYGAPDELPYREDFALRPTAPYEVSKAAADLIARSYWSSHRLPVAVTRFANIYGGGDTNFSRLVPETVSATLDGRAPVLRSDGSPERDLMYVEDAARAYLAIAGALERGEGRGEAFNAGGERPYAVREIVELICRLSHAHVEPEIEGAGNPDGRDRPPVRRLDEAARADGLARRGQPRGRPPPDDRLVPRAPGGATHG